MKVKDKQIAYPHKVHLQENNEDDYYQELQGLRLKICLILQKDDPLQYHERQDLYAWDRQN
jgi:hypothetical protein